MVDVSAPRPSDRVSLRKVALRDGRQLFTVFPSTGAKVEWTRRQYAAGARHFEVGSFLPASRMPQFSDVQDLIAEVMCFEGTCSTAPVLNQCEVIDSLDIIVDEIVCAVSVTEGYSEANMRRSRSRAIALLKTIAELCNVSVRKSSTLAGPAWHSVVRQSRLNGRFRCAEITDQLNPGGKLNG